MAVDYAICGLDWLGDVECVDDAPAPAGEYDFVEVGGAYEDHVCGVRDGVPTCVGGDGIYDEPPPDGVNFSQLDLSYQISCGITTDQELLCWGSHSSEYPTVIVGHEPAGQYFQVAAQVDRACAVNASGCLVCWGVQDGVAPESDPLCVDDVLPVVRD